MFVRTSTVLLPSRWCVVMSVTWIASNCGQVGIRSPHGWVRSTSFTRSIRKVLHPTQLVNDFLRDRKVDELVEGEVLRNLAERLFARHRAFDVLLRDALVLWPGLGLDQEIEGLARDLRVDLPFLDRNVDDLLAVGRVVHRAIRPHERADGALEGCRVVLDGLGRGNVDRVLVFREDLSLVREYGDLWIGLLHSLRLVDVQQRGVGAISN